MSQPVSRITHPFDVVHHPTFEPEVKRAILASWASDASAVPDQPALRWRKGSEKPVSVDDILAALRALDGDAAQMCCTICLMSRSIANNSPILTTASAAIGDGFLSRMSVNLSRACVQAARRRVIMGAKRPDQPADNLGAAQLLSTDELATIGDASAPPAAYPGWMFEVQGQSGAISSISLRAVPDSSASRPAC